MNRHKFNTSTVTDPWKLIRRTARVLGAVALLCILGFATVFAGVPAGYSEFLVPFDEDVFVYVTDPLVAATVDPIPGAYTTHSIISLTAWSDTITVYVDHWENGYGYNENAPDGAGSDEKYTMNLGDTYNFESAAIPRPRTMADGNTYVGAAGDCLAQPAPTGSTIVFRRTTNYCYDGRDRIVSIGGATTMTRGGWINSPFPSPQLGVRASVGEEVYPLAPQLVKYVLPFGEGTGGTSYERVIITIQATEDNTILQIDLDGNGVFDSFNPADGYRTARTNCAPGCLVPTVTLNRGETYVLDRLSDGLTASGLVNKDAVILGSATLQVEYFYGEDNAGLYDTRAVSAYPRGFWGKEYYGPVNSAPDGGFGAASTDVLLYNPNAQTITITWETTTGTGTFTLASEETGFFQAKSGAYVPTGSGVYFRGTDSFWGISDFNTNSGNWDWGYTLVPGYLMTDDQTVAWAPGNVPLRACNAVGGRGGGLFLTASQDNTTFFIDKDGDNVPDTDASIEVLRGTTVVTATNGGYRANRLESLYVTGSNVGTTAGSLCDLTGAHVFATGPFAMAYGENSTRVDATAGTDLGYTALPSPGNWMDLVLTVDKATSPVILSTVAGATTVTFTLVVNSELFDVNTLNVVDTLPANWEYIDNSTTITYPNLTQISGNPADPTVALPTLTWPTGLLGSLLPNQQIIITFQARTTAAFASGALSRNQVEATGTRTVGGVTQTFKARDFVFNTYLATTTNMQITKASSVAEATPLSPGDTFTYTVTSTNPSGTTQVLTGVAQNDVLPPGVTSVAGTTTLSHSSVADSFDSNAYTLNNGTRNWTGAWTETGDDASPTGDDLTVAGGELSLNNDDSVEPTILREVNLNTATSALLTFRYRTTAGVDAADSIQVCGRVSNVAAWTCPLTGGTFTGITGATTGTYSVNLATLGTLTATAQIRFQFGTTTSYEDVVANEAFLVDDLSITYNVSVTGGNPPELLSRARLYSLATNQSLVTTFNVTVDNPFPTEVDELVNVATTIANEIPLPLTASARNIVVVPSLGSGTVGDRVWLDADGDGVFDAGETGLSGVEVTLKDQFSTPLQVTTTDAQGRYLFIDVAPGSGYYVQITGGMPAGTTNTFGDAFNTNGVFTGSTGTATWLTNWSENNDDASPTTGDIQIANNRIEFRDTTDGGTVVTGESIQRSATVSGATSLELTYAWSSVLTNTFADTFPSNAFTNNTGNQNFATIWDEINDGADNAGGGDLRIANNRMEIGGAGLTPEAGDAYQRTATVTGATSLTLRYDWINTVMDTDGSDNILVRYSSDGATWTTIRTINGDANATYVDVIPWTPANTTAYIRFEAEDPIEAGEQGAFDNISLEMNGSDDVIVEYSPDGTTWTTARTLGNAVATGTYTDTIPWTPSNSTAFVRFRAEDALETGEQARIDTVLLTAITGGGLTQTTDTVGDTFGTNGLFTGNTGTLNWLTNWSENGTDDASATTGDTRIINNRIEMGGAGLVVEANDELRRSVTVTGATSIELQYTWAQTNIDADDDTLIQYSTDGTTWTTVRRLDDGTENGAGTYTETIPWVPSNNTFFVRVIAEDAYEAGEIGIIDNVQVRFPQPLRTANFNLAANQDYVQADLGFRANPGSATIGDLVWVDANSDQTRNSGEVGLPGITVQLYADTNADGVPDGSPIATTVTGAGGIYLFTAIPANGALDYVVTMNTSQSGLTGYTATTNTLFYYPNIASGTVRVDADFGFQNPGSTFSITDGVWLDNGAGVGGVASDGIKNGTEAGIAGVTVDLLDAGGATIATATTNAAGLFTFAGVPGGTNYSWRVTDDAHILADYYGTTASALSSIYQMSGSLAANLNCSAASAQPCPKPYVAGAVDARNFGYNQTRTIGDTVWNDNGAGGGTLGNGVQDGTEPGIAGVTVLLYRDVDNDGVFEPGAADGAAFATEVTNASGIYLFAGLPTGNRWFVSIDNTQTALSGYTTLTTSDYDAGAAGHQRQVTPILTGTANRLDIDYGYRAATPFNISGRLFADDNRTGADETEAGIDQVTVELVNSSGTVIGTTTTSSTGAYTFTGLPAGTYTVRVTDTGNVLAGAETTFEKTEAGLAASYNGEETVVLGPTVSDVNFGYYRGNAIPFTRAVISSFVAQEVNGAVVLEWTTASEIGTVGFILKRWDGRESRFEAVTPRLFPALLTAPQGGTYRYTDAKAEAGEDLEYLLVEVEAGGKRIPYGPYRVNTRWTAGAAEGEAMTRDRELNERGASSRAHRKFSGRRSARGEARAAERKVKPYRRAQSAKIAVKEPGIHRVATSQLEADGGLALPRTWNGTFGLSSRGQAISYLATNDGLLFYGAGPESNLEPDNVYRFASTSDRRTMQTRKNPRTAPPTGTETFTRTVHAEQDLIGANNIYKDPEADFWLWEWVFAGEGSKSLAFRADGVQPAGLATITIRLKGGTETDGSPDHHATLTLNGSPIGDIFFDGLESVEKVLEFDPSLLVDGANVLEVEGLIDTSAPYSLFYIDSFDVSYQSRYRAVANQGEFPAAGNPAVLIGGFTRSDISVFDVTNPAHPVQVQAPVSLSGDGTYGAVAASTNPAAIYYAVTPDAFKAAARVVPDTPSALKERGNRGEYLIITTDDLMATAQTLADYRSDLRSQVIDIEDIYDEFNFGNANPHAVREFLNYAKSKWRTAPRYVVLAGDGNYDYKNVQGELNPIPPMMTNTPSGLFPTDSWFGSREEVSQTEVAVGRLPVTTNAELAEVIRKIIAREAALTEPWLHSALLLADNADDGGDYAASSEAVAATLPADLPVVRGYFESQGVDESRIRLLDALNAGTGYVSYFGHGGFDQLADESLFTSVDAPLLTNAQRPAIMTAMTCLAGSSGLPGYSSLGEVLVRQQDGGAAALWAPSGMSENHLAQPMATEFYRAAFDPSVVRLGDAIRTARKAYRQSERPAFMLDLYNLLGDPAMRIR